MTRIIFGNDEGWYPEKVCFLKDLISRPSYLSLPLLLLSVILSPFQDSASAGDVLIINPLVPLRQQMKQLSRDCSRLGPNKRCDEMQKRLRERMIKLRVICRRDPRDQRCGSIMREKKSKGWRIAQFCYQNPHSKKCVRRRERAKRRARILRMFCAKNPDQKRCDPPRRRKGSGYGSLHEYCQAYPDKPKCIALAEKYDLRKPREESISNRF